MNKIKKLIPRCFGQEDGIFNSSTLEVQNSQAIIELAKTQTIALSMILDEFELFMYSKNWADNHIESQRFKIIDFFEKFNC